MPVNPPSARAIAQPLPARSADQTSSLFDEMTTWVARIRVGFGRGGFFVLLAGLVVPVVCTVWAIQAGVPHPLAIMAGYCTLAGSACLCMALLAIRSLIAKAPAPAPRREPNFAAWRLVSTLRVADAARLWCGAEPGGPASQEAIAWAQAMLDAIRRGELAVHAKPGEAADRERTNPSWRTEIARDALKAWAKAHGHRPQFLES